MFKIRFYQKVLYDFRRNMSFDSIKKLVLTWKKDKIFFVSINRPEKKNCVNHETAKELIDAFKTFEADESADIAILTGQGETFCAGYDLFEVATNNFPKNEYATQFLKNYRFMGPSMMLLSKPLIAAIEGYAVAGGLELALLADLRIASKTAQFGVLCRRFGVPLIDGGTIRLPAIVGFSRAMDLILTGRPIDAKLGFDWGLVNRLCSPGSALNEAEKLAEEILQNPQRCLRADRLSAYNSVFNSKNAHDSFDFELKNGIPVLNEAVKGAAKFIKKEHSKI